MRCVTPIISVITWIEISYGYRNMGVGQNDRLDTFTSFLREASIEVVNLDQNIGSKYIELKTEMKRNPLADFDLLIASTALARNTTLVTRNIKHFSRVPSLQLFDL